MGTRCFFAQFCDAADLVVARMAVALPGCLRSRSIQRRRHETLGARMVARLFLDLVVLQ